LKKAKPSSVARTAPIARLAENGAALICASPTRYGCPKQRLAPMVA
jgi:predicted nicotinamide N-methyase